MSSRYLSVAVTDPNPVFEWRLLRVARLMAIACGLLGLLVFVGWLLDIDRLKHIVETQESMKANTAVGFLLGALAVRLSARSDKSKAVPLIVSSSLLLVGLATLTFAQDLFGFSYGIDEWLFFDTTGGSSSGAPGRMSPATSIAFLFSGLAIIGLTIQRATFTAQLLALGSLSIALIIMIGYIFQINSLYTVAPFTSMAPHTALGFLLLDLGILLSYPGVGLIQPLPRQASIAVLLRTLLPPAIVAPLGLGIGLLAAVQFAMIDAAFAIAVVSTASVVFLLAVSWRSAHTVAEHEYALKAERNHYETILKSIGDAVIVTDTNRRVIFMNKVAELLTGWSFTDALDRPIDEIFRILNEATREPMKAPVADALISDHTVTLSEPVILIDRSGKESIIDDSASPIWDEAGHQQGVVLVFRDVAERRSAELTIRKTQRRLTAALEAGRLGEWELDLTSHEITRNLRHDQIFGYDELEPSWTFDRFLQHCYFEDREKVEAGFHNIVEAGTGDWTFECRIVHPNNKLRWIWVSATLTDKIYDEPTRMSGVVQDITQRRRQEDSNRFLAAIAVPLNTLIDDKSTLQSVASLTVPFLADCCVIDLIDEAGQAQRTASACKDDDSGALLHRLNLTDASDGSVLRGLLTHRKIQYLNQLQNNRFADLTENPAQLALLDALAPSAFMGVPLLARNRLLGVMSLFTIDSGREFNQNDIVLAEQMAERVGAALENTRLYKAVQDADERKEVFLAMLAHELRNPLGALSNGLALLRPKVAEDPEARWTFDMLSRQHTQLKRLLDDLLDVSRISRGLVKLEKHPTELNTVLNNAIVATQALRDEKHQTLTTQFDDQMIVVNADDSRLEQIFSNLLTNAAKYTPDSGSISISTQRDAEEVIITVADTGVGLERDDLDSIFELFEQVHPDQDTTTPGLGLGLALVKDLVTMHSGTVTADSEGVDRGSAFAVRLPVLDSSGVVPASPTPTEAASETAPLRILIVDDNADSIRALGMLLEQQGHKVSLAFDGRSALKISAEDRPDLILLDIGLPDVNGYQVAERIRQQANADVHLVAVTGFGQQSDRERSKAAGFDDHLVKPLDLDSLYAIIRKRNRA